MVTIAQIYHNISVSGKKSTIYIRIIKLLDNFLKNGWKILYCHYLRTFFSRSNFTKNLSPPTVFELEGWNFDTMFRDIWSWILPTGILNFCPRAKIWASKFWRRKKHRFFRNFKFRCPYLCSWAKIQNSGARNPRPYRSEHCVKNCRRR